MFDSLRRFCFSVLRWPRSHGFGVQPPFAYTFITQVVRDKVHHDYYESLGEHYHRSSFRLQRFYLRLFNFLNEDQCFNSVYVIEDIHASTETLSLWESVVKSPKVVVSFDLYDCGVIFVEGKMPKFNYKVMLV